MNMRRRKKRMLMMEEMPPHLLPLHHHLRCPLLLCLKRLTKKALWRRQLRLYHALLRDYEEHLLRMGDDFDDWKHDPNEGCADVNDWFPEDESNDGD
jgi:hypothetical protein